MPATFLPVAFSLAAVLLAAVLLAAVLLAVFLFPGFGLAAFGPDAVFGVFVAVAFSADEAAVAVAVFLLFLVTALLAAFLLVLLAGTVLRAGFWPAVLAAEAFFAAGFAGAFFVVAGRAAATVFLPAFAVAFFLVVVGAAAVLVTALAVVALLRPAFAVDLVMDGAAALPAERPDFEEVDLDDALADGRDFFDAEPEVEALDERFAGLDGRARDDDLATTGPSGRIPASPDDGDDGFSNDVQSQKSGEE